MQHSAPVVVNGEGVGGGAIHPESARTPKSLDTNLKGFGDGGTSLRSPNHYLFHRHMADDDPPWDPEALEQLLPLKADLAALLAFLAPRGPSGDNGPPKASAGPSSNLDRS